MRKSLLLVFVIVIISLPFAFFHMKNQREKKLATFKQGQEAFLSGMSINSNPYPEGYSERMMWYRGFMREFVKYAESEK